MSPLLGGRSPRRQPLRGRARRQPANRKSCRCRSRARLRRRTLVNKRLAAYRKSNQLMASVRLTPSRPPRRPVEVGGGGGGGGRGGGGGASPPPPSPPPRRCPACSGAVRRLQG